MKKLTRNQAIRALVSAIVMPVMAASQERTLGKDKTTQEMKLITFRGPLAKLVDTNCTVETPRYANSIRGFDAYDCKGPTWVELDFDQIGGVAIRTKEKLIRVSAAEIIEALEAK